MLIRQWIWVTAVVQARSRDDEGQTMVEYALICALISIVSISFMFLLGPYLRNLFQDLINAMNQAKF